MHVFFERLKNELAVFLFSLNMERLEKNYLPYVIFEKDFLVIFDYFKGTDWLMG